MTSRSLPLVVTLFGGRPAFAEPEHYERIRVDGGMTGSSVAIADRDGVGSSPK